MNQTALDLAISVLPALLNGLKTTLWLFSWTLIISLPLGIILGLFSTSKFKIVRTIIGLYTWIIRGTPLLLQIFFIFFGLPLYGIVFDRFNAVLIAFTINYTAYYAEIFRGGIQSVNKGQYEAAKVLGLTPWQTTRKVIIPQVIKIILPSVGNEVITLVKDTSLVYALGLDDLMRAARVASQREVSIVPLIVVALIYLILTGIVTLVLKVIERKLNYYK